MTMKSKRTKTPEREAKECELATLSALAAESNAAAVVEAFAKGVYGEIDTQRFYDLLTASIDKGNSLRKSERVLLSQAHALDVMFANLARRGHRADTLPQYEAHMRLALRAQNQCRMTLETLATIKNPPVVFAKQANIANNQQVNNGEAVSVAHAGENGTTQNEQSRIGHDKRQSLDGSTLQDAIGSRPPLEAVAAINRPKDSQG